MMTLTISGHLETLKVLQDLGDRAAPALRAALYQEGTDLLNDADLLVPRDIGTLAGSKFQTETEDGVVVGYGGAASPYALAVHENPRSGVTGGVSPSGKKYQHWAAVGQWKYLETPFKARMTGFADRIARSLRQTLLRGR